jgi:hypothetical protein
LVISAPLLTLPLPLLLGSPNISCPFVGFALGVPGMLNNPLPRSPPIRTALLFQGLDQVSPDLCCSQITLPCCDQNMSSVRAELVASPGPLVTNPDLGLPVVGEQPGARVPHCSVKSAEVSYSVAFRSSFFLHCHSR